MQFIGRRRKELEIREESNNTIVLFEIQESEVGIEYTYLSAWTSTGLRLAGTERTFCPGSETSVELLN
jgi:hypothetical protein